MNSKNRWITSRIHAPVPFALTILLGTFEGIDIASIGVAMSRMTRELGLNAAQGGYCASAGMLGLAVGAAIGGRLADLLGRRLMMIVSILFLGVFSIASAHAWNFESMFVARLCAGLGMGSLMPILIALANASASERFRSTAISIMMASGGIGSGLAASVSQHPDWRAVFYVGGAGPIIVIPLILIFLPRGSTEHGVQMGRAHRPLSIIDTLFHPDRRIGTFIIWALAFLISLVSYVMLNWLPTLLIQKGATESESHSAMIFYALGVIAGNILSGAVLDRGFRKASYVITYFGAGACITGLAVIGSSGVLFLLAGVTALFIFGAQLITFSLTPIFYPPTARATGIGAMVSAGRLGSVVGPVIVGLLLHSGLSAETVLLSLVPVCLLSPLLGIAFVRRLQSMNK